MVAGAGQAADCTSILPPASPPAHATRSITSGDLVGLRDFGPMGVGDVNAELFGLSPDHRRAAFQIRRADATSNSYCFAMVVLDLRPGGGPVVVDTGGEYIRETYSVLGFAANTAPGTPKSIIPQWSPDGHWIAYLRRDLGSIQVWRAPTDGGPGEQVTHAGFDVERFAWTKDGEGVIFSGRPALVAANRAIDAEGLKGFHFDDRFMPASSDRPLVREPVAVEVFVQNIGQDTARVATSSETLELDPDQDPRQPAGARVVALDDAGLAWTDAAEDGNVASPTRLHTRSARFGTRICTADICDGITNLWWTKDQSALLYLRREGWRLSQTGLYLWRAGRPLPERVLITDDALLGCQMLNDSHLLCGDESSLRPRRLISINFETGELRPIFDPNPEFSLIRLGSVTRLKFKNSYGVPTFADLVLPPDHQPGQTHPLIVVNYESRGFLRGGTGDEYPIQVLAARGFAVLSMQNPISIGMSHGAKSYEEVNRMNRVNWVDRRSIVSSIETAINLAVARGVADPKRVGITGLSDGASTVIYALINTRRFAAAAVSSCCEEPSVVGYLDGPAVGGWLNAMGYPTLMQPDDAFSAATSFRLSGAKVEAPLLMQLADREYMASLEGYTALKELGKPVDLYVFPDENHVKWQPAHRKAAYDRAVDWFVFWLEGQEDSDPSKTDQYRRWEAMRAAAGNRTGVAPGL
jgi:dipeptidyl aminopeptidase/acylaminoacyl peptidase